MAIQYQRVQQSSVKNPYEHRQKLIFAVLTLSFLALVSRASFAEISHLRNKLRDNKDEEPIIRDSAMLRLTLCVPKTGTSALEWITQSLFDNVAKSIGNGEAIVVKKYKKHALKWKSKALKLDVNGKHYGEVNEDAPELQVAPAAHFCSLGKIPGYSDKCFTKIRNFENYPNASATTVPIVFFTTFRDPIATTVSYVYYRRGKIGKTSLSNHILSNHLCEETAVEMALRYRLATEFLPAKGYKFHVLFFEDMRVDPTSFVRRYADLIGLRVNDEIVQKTIQETSVENMKQIQREFKRSPGNHSREEYSGLSGRGVNARKVRKAEIKGYVNELNEQALNHCRHVTAFHLPEILRNYWNFSDVEVVRPIITL